MVTVTYNLNEKLNAIETVSIATKEMRHGVRPNLAKKNITAGSSTLSWQPQKISQIIFYIDFGIFRNFSDINTGKLLLTHGYCASDNPWEKYPDDWTDAIYFSNPNQNINNQEFAQRLYEFVEKSDLSSFGVVRISGVAYLQYELYFLSLHKNIS